MGKSTPRSMKRLRMLYVQMLRDHQSGKEHLTPTLLLKVSDHIGVLDGYTPKRFWCSLVDISIRQSQP